MNNKYNLILNHFHYKILKTKNFSFGVSKKIEILS